MYLDLLVFLHFILRGNIANRTSDRVGAFLRRRSSSFRSSLERRERDRNSSTASDRERERETEKILVTAHRSFHKLQLSIFAPFSKRWNFMEENGLSLFAVRGDDRGNTS